MSANTSIEWTDHTFNPWWGCTRVSPGCANCYAATLGHRFGVEWGKSAHRRPASEKVWAEPKKWNAAAKKAGKRAKVFCASMADVFDEEAPEYGLDRLFPLMRETPWLDWQVLTKRPENIRKNLPGDWGRGGYRNVWLGVSVENQEMAEKRIPILLEIPAAIRFLSCEPLLGPVSLLWAKWMDIPSRSNGDAVDLDGLRGIHWIIAGGESGRGARPTHPDWIRKIQDQAVAAGVAFLFKQWGEWRPYEHLDGRRQIPFREMEDGQIVIMAGKKESGRLLDGREWNQFPDPFLALGVAP